MKIGDDPSRDERIRLAKENLERKLAKEIAHQLFIFQLDLEGFPTAIEVELGETLTVNGVDRPRVTVRVKL